MTDYKAVQQRLNDLGANPPLVVDGIYGPMSRAAVIKFQSSKGLAADGIVGPLTLTALGIGGTISVTASGAPHPPADPNNIHVKAKAAADALGLTPAESAFIRAVAWHETNYGQGWGSTPPPDGGAGSFNMGAITTANPGPLDFRHKDSRNDTGQVVEYTTWFKGYPSFQAGMQGLAQEVLKPNVRAAIAANAKNPQAAFAAGVKGMYDNHYFLGIHPRNTDAGNQANVQDYFNAVTKAFGTISANTYETLAIGAGIGAGVLFVVGGLAWAGWRLFRGGI